jgi:renalase
MMQIAVVGAGLSGLTFTHAALAAGHRVTVFEKSRGASGRLSTRTDRSQTGALEGVSFDHGAPLMQAHTATFRTQCELWCAEGFLAPYRDGYVALPRMNGLGHQLARACADGATTSNPAAFYYEHRVLRAHHSPLGWTLDVASGAHAAVAAGQNAPARAHGTFDALVVALPADQAGALLAAAPLLAGLANGVRSLPCWVAMLDFAAPLSQPVASGELRHPLLASVWREAEKPARAAVGERWVVHATAEWSRSHLEHDAAHVAQTLAKAFMKLCGTQDKPRALTPHRWRYSQAAAPLALPCLWFADMGLGACGDWLSGQSGTEGAAGVGRAEHAWLSARALAKAIAPKL